jgi:hypothetical protein
MKYATFANGLTASVSDSIKVGDRVRTFQTSYFNQLKKCFFTSTVIEISDWVYPTAIQTTNEDSPLFEGNEHNAI